VQNPLVLSSGAMNSSSLFYPLLADLVVLVHAAFVLFVIFGGLLAIKWQGVAWIHLPAAVWGAIVEIFGWVCPLTPLENWLRQKGGESGYGSDFIARYVLPTLYPADLTRGVQTALGLFVILVNLVIYTWIFRSPKAKRDS
jgi:hypothetical protein